MPFSEANLKRSAYYEDHYQTIVDLPLVAESRTKICDHEDESERTCRFCGKSKPDVSFKKTAHAIPECLGNKSLISMNECDACNKFFANEYEDHLAKWFGPMRTLCQMRGKNKKNKGFPKYKAEEFTAERSDRGMELWVNADSSTVDIREGGSFKIPVEMPTQPYIPLRAAQAFVKSAISVLPTKLLSECENTILWLSNRATVRINSFPVSFAFTPGPNPHANGRARILMRRDPDAEIPLMWFVLATANFLFQIMIPFCKSDAWIRCGKDTKLELVPFPTPFPKAYEEKFGKTVWYQEDWASSEVTVQNRQASFHVEGVEEDQGNNQVMH